MFPHSGVRIWIGSFFIVRYIVPSCPAACATAAAVAMQPCEHVIAISNRHILDLVISPVSCIGYMLAHFGIALLVANAAKGFSQ